MPGRLVASGRWGGIAGNPERWVSAAGPSPGEELLTSEDADGGQPSSSRLLAVEQVADRVADAIVRIASSRCGSVPGGWRRWAETHLKPKHDWRAEVARLLLGAISQASGMVDHTCRRPSRRAAAAYPAVLPSLVMPRIEVAVDVDTLASMDESLLGEALSKLEGILAANGRSTATVYAVDAEVQDVRRVRSARDIQLTGSGTDMGVGIARAAEQRPRPNVIVVLTDGLTPWPTKAPAMPVIVGIIEPPYHRYHGISACGGLYPGSRASSGRSGSFGSTAPPWARVLAITAENAA